MFLFFLQSRAKQLYNAGYKTLSHLANADPVVLSKAIENLYQKQANQIVASAKVSITIINFTYNGFTTLFSSDNAPLFQMLVNEKAAALQEEVDDLLMIPLDLPMP